MDDRDLLQSVLQRILPMRFAKIPVLISNVGLLVLITGCPSPSKVAESEKFSSAELNDTSAPVTFLDRESLQSGTGVMDEDASPDFLATESGLKYRVLRRSDERKPKASDTVTVHYRGWLDSGREFDSSYKRGEPTTFPLNGVISGWTEGMQLIGEGGMIELWIPSRLGYGTKGSPGSIPPNANLHFIVELVRIR